MFSCFFFFFLLRGRVFFFFFFFQAEDGIRDLYVTGVQTCALPISACTIRHYKQEEPAIEDSEFAFVRNLWSGARDWKKLGHRRWGVGHVNHEISHSHFAARNESGDAREQPERDHESANELNPAADLHHGLI